MVSLRVLAFCAVTSNLVLPARAVEEENRLSLADLPAYRAALSGKAAADDAHANSPPRRVTFRDLWDHPGDYQGRRVQVQGRVARVFRQGAVGAFPALAEVWINSPAGDPTCLVFPDGAAEREPRQGLGPHDSKGGDMVLPEHPTRKTDESQVDRVLEPGAQVEFVGTYLKQVRYTAGDGDRLAPLVVGDRPPQATSSSSDAASSALRAIGGGSAGLATSWSPTAWVLGLVLAILAGAVIVQRHSLMTVARKRSRSRDRDLESTDVPLEFVEREPLNGDAVRGLGR